MEVCTAGGDAKKVSRSGDTEKVSRSGDTEKVSRSGDTEEVSRSGDKVSRSPVINTHTHCTHTRSHVRTSDY